MGLTYPHEINKKVGLGASGEVISQRNQARKILAYSVQVGLSVSDETISHERAKKVEEA